MRAFPGERLIIHFGNGLTGLTIRDYFSPQYTPKGQPVPIYPEQMTSSPINLHTHGLHISPKGNADNVLLHIPPGMSNTYTYDIPRNMPQGAYWYHSHLHGLTSAQVYEGLVGLLAIGRMDGNLPVVSEKSIPVRTMALQYNFVFDRAGGMAELTESDLATVGQLHNGAEARRTGQRNLPSITRAGELQQIQTGNDVPDGLVRGAVVNPQYARALSIHPEQFAEFTAADGKTQNDFRLIYHSLITSVTCNSP